MLIAARIVFALVALVSVITQRGSVSTDLVEFAATVAMDTLLVMLFLNANTRDPRTTGWSYYIRVPGVQDIVSAVGSIGGTTTGSTTRPTLGNPVSRLTTDLIVRPTTDLIVLSSLPVAPTCPITADLIIAPAFDLILYGAETCKADWTYPTDLILAPTFDLIVFGTQSFEMDITYPATVPVVSPSDHIVYGSDNVAVPPSSAADATAHLLETDTAPSGDVVMALAIYPLNPPGTIFDLDTGSDNNSPPSDSDVSLNTNTPTSYASSTPPKGPMTITVPAFVVYGAYLFAFLLVVYNHLSEAGEHEWDKEIRRLRQETEELERCQDKYRASANLLPSSDSWETVPDSD